MADSHKRPSNPVSVARLGLGVIVIAIGLAAIIWIRARYDGYPAAFATVLLWQIVVWIPWLGFAPLVFSIVRRISLATLRPAAWLLVHSVSALLVVGAHYLWFRMVSTMLSPYVGLDDTRYGVFAYFFIFWSALDLLFYGLILAVAHGDRFRQRYESGERRVAELERALGDASRATEPPADDRFDYLSFVDAGRRQVIPVRQVRWIEADGYYAGLHTDAGKFLIRESLNALSAKLAPDSFIRVHRSTIVNLDYVKSYGSDDSDGWSVTLADGTRRRVSRSGRRRLKDKFR